MELDANGDMILRHGGAHVVGEPHGRKPNRDRRPWLVNIEAGKLTPETYGRALDTLIYMALNEPEQTTERVLQANGKYRNTKKMKRPYEGKVQIMAVEALINRIAGKPVERQEISGPDGGPLDANVRVKKLVYRMNEVDVINASGIVGQPNS